MNATVRTISKNVHLTCPPGSLARMRDRARRLVESFLSGWGADDPPPAEPRDLAKSFFGARNFIVHTGKGPAALWFHVDLDDVNENEDYIVSHPDAPPRAFARELCRYLLWNRSDEIADLAGLDRVQLRQLVEAEFLARADVAAPSSGKRKVSR